MILAFVRTAENIIESRKDKNVCEISHGDQHEREQFGGLRDLCFAVNRNHRDSNDSDNEKHG